LSLSPGLLHTCSTTIVADGKTKEKERLALKVLLLVPPYVRGFMRNARWDGMTISGSNWYPIFMAYCTGLLAREGHQTKLVDAQVDRLSPDQVYEVALRFSPDLTVIYFSLKSLQNDLGVANQISRLTKSEIVLVGHAASFDPSGTLRASSAINMLVLGEFDFTVLDIANRVPKERVQGLVWKDNEGEVHRNPPREPIPSKELDGYPFVTDVYKRHLKIKNYRLSGHRWPYVDLFTGRGCSWGYCSFCLWPHTMYGGPGSSYRTRSIENVIEELKFIKRELPYVKEVYFQDDNMPKERAIALSEAIRKNGIKLRWSCYSRATLDLETMRLMKEAGCYILETGFESSNPEILKNIKKGVTIAQMEEYARNARKAGLTVIGAFITGLPGETEDTIRATTEWLNKLPILRYTITLPKPYPGTPFYSWLVEHNCLKDGRPNYPGLSTEDIYSWNKWSLKRSYLNRRFLFKILRRPSEWGNVARSAKYFLPYVFSREKEDTVDLEW